MGKLTGLATAFVILFIIIVALAGLAVAVVNALYNNPWGVFTIAMTIPIAMVVGVYMFKIRPGAILSGSIVGVIAVCAAVFLGAPVAESGIASWFTFDKKSPLDPAARLRVLRRGASRVAAAGAPGLPQHLHEDRRRRGPRRSVCSS